MRRGQILRASARGERAPAIARQLGCDDQTVRNVIHEFNATGLTVLQEGSSRPHQLHTSFSQDGLVRLKELLHRSPRDFDKDRGVWTLELAAQVSFEQGIITTPISDESVRRALKRLKTNWKRAKHWITSPDPQYQQKKPSGQKCRLRGSDILKEREEESSPSRRKAHESSPEVYPGEPTVLSSRMLSLPSLSETVTAGGGVGRAHGGEPDRRGKGCACPPSVSRAR